MLCIIYHSKFCSFVYEFVSSVLDDYNIPIELPVLVQTLNEQHLDVVPESKADQITETQLIISQRTFDCEQFVQRRAQKLCIDSQLEYRHCEDYDIKLVHVNTTQYMFFFSSSFSLSSFKGVSTLW